MQSLLSNQEKLALAMTSATSARDLARFMGLNHQKVLRWLREGEPGGVKKIPTDPETNRLIDEVFEAHKENARLQAHTDKIPFDEEAPVFAFRHRENSDRVFVNKTNFMRSDLRTGVFLYLHETQKYAAVSVSSVVTLSTYLQQADQRARRKKRPRSVMQEVAKQILKRHLAEGTELHRIFTKIESFAPVTDPYTAVKALNAKIRQKHEPATSDPKTILADKFLLQLLPQNYVGFTRPKATAKRTKKPR